MDWKLISWGYSIQVSYQFENIMLKSFWSNVRKDTLAWVLRHVGLSAGGCHRVCITKVSPLAVLMFKSVSQRAHSTAEALHQTSELWNNWWESEESFWAMGPLIDCVVTGDPNIQRLGVCHLCHFGGGGCSYECKATQGGCKSCGTQEGYLKKRLSITWCPFNCEDFCWWN